MKRIGNKEKLRLVLYAKKRFIRSVLRKNKAYGSHKNNRAPSNSVPVPAPKVFSIDENADSFIQWLGRHYDSMTSWLLKINKRRGKGKPIKANRVPYYSDFKSIRKMTPAGALVTAALYDRGRQLSGSSLRVYDYDKWDSAVRQTLEQVGFFQILDINIDSKNIVHQYNSNIVKIERFETGDVLKQDKFGLLVDKLLSYLLEGDDEYFSNDKRIVRTAKLYDALVEATENTRRHAYPDDIRTKPEVLPNWWLTGSVNSEERKLTLVVYDLGISIPGSLASHRDSQWAGHNYVNRVIKRFTKGEFDENDPQSDHAKIRLAMKHGYSATGLSYRGKGLPVVREAIRYCQRGRLHILSRYGEYVEETGKKPTSKQLASAMPGTLIVWELWL